MVRRPLSTASTGGKELSTPLATAPPVSGRSAAAAWGGLVAVAIMAGAIALLAPIGVTSPSSILYYSVYLSATAPILAALVVGSITLHQSVAADRTLLEQRLLGHLRRTYGVTLHGWGQETEAMLRGAHGGLPTEVERALVGHRNMVRRGRAVRSLGLPPIVALASATALAAWALPATEVFLSYTLPALNHFLTAYEMLVVPFSLAFLVALMRCLRRW